MAEWSGEPAYKQVAEALRIRIRSGELPVGEQLPSLAQLMSDYGVSITVVRRALQELRAEGVVTTHQGKGAFVRDVPTATPHGAASPEYEAIIRQLEAVQEHVQGLEERLGTLEEAVRGRSSPAKKPRPQASP